MNLASIVLIPAHVMARTVGEETVILNLATGTYFGLNPVGAQIWQLMGEGKSLSDICDALQAKFEVSRADIERDVLDLAETLHQQQLISAS